MYWLRQARPTAASTGTSPPWIGWGRERDPIRTVVACPAIKVAPRLLATVTLLVIDVAGPSTFRTHPSEGVLGTLLAATILRYRWSTPHVARCTIALKSAGWYASATGDQCEHLARSTDERARTP